MNPKTRNLLLAFLVGLVIAFVFSIDGWLGRTYYAQDAVSYLDISKAISRGDWTTALNPYWSPGYPLLLSATHWMYPAGAVGEWTGIHALNLLVMMGTYLAFLYFLRVATVFTARANGASETEAGEGANGFLFAIGTSIFVLWQLLSGNNSRVSPDPLVSGFFFLISATALRFCLRPCAKAAAVMGLLLGLAFLAKAVYLALSAGMVGVLVLYAVTRPAAARLPTLSKLGVALPVMGLVMLPYVLALSHTVGTFTLGQSSSLNYAWNVNHMPRSSDWQGGPEPFGRPLHPTHLVLKNPPVFTFAEPFAVTYSPWFNPPYWNAGYHQFFNLKNQLSTIVQNLSLLRRCFFDTNNLKISVLEILPCIGVALYVVWQPVTYWRRLFAIWPLILLPVSAICVYLPVVIEIRYIVGFIIVLLVTPFLPLSAPTRLISCRAGYILATVIAVWGSLVIVANKTPVIQRLTHHESFIDDPAWKLGLNLSQFGVKPGDRVADVKIGSSADCTWAYVGGAHIVAEIGNDAYDRDDDEKVRNMALFTENPEIQQTVFQLFEQAGAKIVVVVDRPVSPKSPGWIGMPGTPYWVHFLP